MDDYASIATGGYVPHTDVTTELITAARAEFNTMPEWTMEMRLVEALEKTQTTPQRLYIVLYGYMQEGYGVEGAYTSQQDAEARARSLLPTITGDDWIEIQVWENGNHIETAELKPES